MPRQINDDGLKLIKQWEGIFLTAYHGAADRPGLLTIGAGHTSAAGPPPVTPGMTITNEQVDEILRSDLSKVEASVESLVKVPLNDNQFATLVSFTFNCGTANFAASTLLKKLNASDYESVPAQLMRWVNANGIRVRGLVNRRSAECGLWAKGAFVSSSTVKPQAPVNDIYVAMLEGLGGDFSSSGVLQMAETVRQHGQNFHVKVYGWSQWQSAAAWLGAQTGKKVIFGYSNGANETTGVSDAGFEVDLLIALDPTVWLTVSPLHGNVRRAVLFHNNSWDIVGHARLTTGTGWNPATQKLIVIETDESHILLDQDPIIQGHIETEIYALS